MNRRMRVRDLLEALGDVEPDAWVEFVVKASDVDVWEFDAVATHADVDVHGCTVEFVLDLSDQETRA